MCPKPFGGVEMRRLEDLLAVSNSFRIGVRRGVQELNRLSATHSQRTQDTQQGFLLLVGWLPFGQVLVLAAGEL